MNIELAGGGIFAPEPLSVGDIATLVVIGLIYLGLALFVVTSERRDR